MHLDTVKLIRELFGHADSLYGWVPMYPSGWWSRTLLQAMAPATANRCLNALQPSRLDVKSGARVGNAVPLMPCPPSWTGS